jgi:hypothetical protein
MTVLQLLHALKQIHERGICHGKVLITMLVSTFKILSVYLHLQRGTFEKWKSMS